MEFKDFKNDVERAFNAMATNEHLYVVDVDKDLLWMGYLLSYEESEQQGHNCNSCKSFIRHYGKVVAIDPTTFEVKTFWDDVHTPGYEKTAADLAKLVKSAPVCNIFIQEPGEFYGCDHNQQMLEDGKVITWHHLYAKIPNRFEFNKRVGFDSAAAFRGDAFARKGVMARSITELTVDAVETVVDLVESGTLYRGEEFLKSLNEFSRMKSIAPSEGTKLNNFCWLNYNSPVAKIRNTAMGTLLIDLSEEIQLETAVRRYEAMMAPANYKRPSALITKKQISAAQTTVATLGLTDALPRRHAKVEDISVNDVLFVNRDTSKLMKCGNIFDSLAQTKTVNPKEFTKSAEISIDKFLSEVLPGSAKVEVLFENNHISNLVTLTAPVNPDAGHLFKWNNNFAWVYNGSVADSFKEKVKAAGGTVEGFLRCSLHWFNYDDLDIHVVEPNGNQIYYGHYQGYTGGVLDVDMNAGSGKSRDAVENIIWRDSSKLRSGTYKLFIQNFNRRESIDTGFECEIEFGGEIHKFTYDKMVIGNIDVATIEVDSNKNVTINTAKGITEGKSSCKSIKEWSMDTLQFQEVSCIMRSPNHWESNSIGNKHVFFMLENCKNPDPVRGFFNEYLRADLEKDHKRVFEAIGSMSKAEYNDSQLSGLGFSSTNRSEMIVRVDNKLFKIKF